MEPRSNITGGPTRPVFAAKVLGKYSISYFQCCDTGYLQTERPYWLDEAYASPINISDTGIVLRNQRFLPIVGSLLHCLFPANARFLDYAGGYGIFTRMMRDVGFDYFWTDPYATNLCARGFEIDAETGRPITAATAFEVLEHLACPRQDLGAVFNFTSNVIFSTLLLPAPLPNPAEWWYYALDHGQHISFYSRISLEYIAKQQGLKLASNGNDLHFFFEPTLIPRIIPTRCWRQWMKGKSKEIQSLTEDAFTFEREPASSMRRGAIIKHLYRLGTVPGMYVLKPSLNQSTRAALQTAELTKFVAEHLLHDGTSYWKEFSPKFHSRTVDDMKLLCDRVAKQRSNS